MDAPTRVLHWLMALSFAGAYLTSEMDGWRLLHISFGFTMAGAVAARLVWGLIGPRPARLSSWVARIRPLLKGAGRGSSAGSTQPSWNMAVVLGIVLGSVLVVASGITMNQGWGGEALGEAMEELHEVAGNAVLLLVLAHLSLLAATNCASECALQSSGFVLGGRQRASSWSGCGVSGKPCY